MIAYFDTSAVVPLLVVEAGTDVSLRVFLQAETPVRGLGRDHALRGYDAVHCAAALRVTSGTTVALAGNRDLLAAWQREGLQVLDTQS